MGNTFFCYVTFISSPIRFMESLQVPSGCRPTLSLPRTSHLVLERHSCILAPILTGKTVYSQGSLVSALSALRAASQSQPRDFTGMGHVTVPVLSKHQEVPSLKDSLISHQAWGGETTPALPYGHGKRGGDTNTRPHSPKQF